MVQEELLPSGKCAQRAAGFKSQSVGGYMTGSVGKTGAVARISKRQEIFRVT